MATSQQYIDFVLEQLNGTGELRCCKMFGEYIVSVDDRPVLCVCDNTVYVKILPETAALLPDAQTGFPYEGAKERYILDIEDRELSARVVSALCRVTPQRRPKGKKAD